MDFCCFYEVFAGFYGVFYGIFCGGLMGFRGHLGAFLSGFEVK